MVLLMIHSLISTSWRQARNVDNHTALLHIKACNSFCQSSADNTQRMLEFVLATIQQQLETVPNILDSFVEHGAASAYAFGAKRGGLDWLGDHRASLYAQAMGARANDDTLLAVFLQVPGLGMVKAGFACQLFAGRVGCLDTHNIAIYGLKSSALRFSKKALPDTQAKHRARYIELCNKLGGAVALWARWCDYKATLKPSNWSDAGTSVSLLHIECLQDNYKHNVRAFMTADGQAEFEREAA